MQKKICLFTCLLVTAAILLAACTPAAPTAAGTATAPAAQATATTAASATTAPSATSAATETSAVTATSVITPTSAADTAGNWLVSMPAVGTPTLDGAGDDAAWTSAPVLTLETTGGANASATVVSLQSVYDDKNVYFLVSYADPTQSFIRGPWEKQADGSWIRLASKENKGGDETEYYEDKLAFIWSIDNSIKGFEEQGCFTACHAGENPEVKPFGNKYTSSPEETGDIWHWKSVRNLGQLDDQFLDNTRYSPDTPEAGRKSDPNDAGGYVNNETEDKKLPAFMAPNGGDKTGTPGFILDSEKVPFDDAQFKAGDRLPAVVISAFTGDRGNISAAWKYADGRWTVEFSRPLTTGSAFDVQFDDLTGTYYFGLATFDNAQVRHATQNGGLAFTFQPK